MKRGQTIWGQFIILAVAVPLILTVLGGGPALAKPVKLGSSQALNISWGVDVKEGLELCVDYMNQKGGLKVGGEEYKIEYVVYDDKYRPDLGQSAAQRLINLDRVKAIVGSAGSAPVVASLPAVQSAGLCLFTSAHSEKLLDPKLKYVYATATARSVDALYPLILKAKPGIKTAVVAAQDDETGHNLADKAVHILKSYGVKILDTFYFPRSQRDYTPIATKVASLNPDFFPIPGFGGAAETTGLMAKALHNTAWRGTWFVTASPVIKDLSEICPRGEADGLLLPMTDLTMMSKPPRLATEIRRLSEEKYGKWRAVGPYWSLPIWFYAAAVERAKSFEASKIDQAMQNLEIDTPIGRARTFKRPDLGNMKYVDTLVTPSLAEVKGDKTVFPSEMSIDDAIKAMEKNYGFQGQWE